MKHVIPSILLATTLGLCACQGPAGPAGQPGANGQAGAPGAPGANGTPGHPVVVPVPVVVHHDVPVPVVVHDHDSDRSDRSYPDDHH
jgi:hypothetical protein